MSAYLEIKERIQSVARSSGVAPPVLLAVSKSQSAEKMMAMYAEGQRDFAENYLQELVAKMESFRAQGLRDARWHFIGHLQTNKVKSLLTEVPGLVSIHSIDSLKLAESISKRTMEVALGHPIAVFLEVNIDREPSKGGFDPDHVVEAARVVSALPELSLEGLMCIPLAAPQGNPREAFRRLRELEISLGPLSKRKLSMGMSGDFEDAVREGSTHLRIGTALFGSRQ